MKITINVDCTPLEARQFLGLPDVGPLQEAMMSQLQAQMSKQMSQMDPESLMKVWFPMGLEGMEQLQRAFWANLSGGKGSSGSD